MKRSTLTGDDSLHAPLKYCDVEGCGLECAITIEETPESREAHYRCQTHGRMCTISTNLEARKAPVRRDKNRTGKSVASAPSDNRRT